MAAAAASRDVDYAEAGRALLARVNLPADGDGVPKVERYSNYNALWRHPTTGGTLYVGNASTAASRPMLEDMKCSNIVFCRTCARFFRLSAGRFGRSVGPSIDSLDS